MGEIEARLNSPTQKAVCDLSDWIDANDKDDHVHYGCSWHIRDDGIWHVCSEKKTEWKIEEAWGYTRVKVGSLWSLKK